MGEFVYDVETDSLNIIEANLVGVSFCFNQKIAYYIPVQHVDHDEKKIQSQISLKSFLSIIAPIMKDESIIKIGHNIKYDNSAPTPCHSVSQFYHSLYLSLMPLISLNEG